MGSLPSKTIRNVPVLCGGDHKTWSVPTRGPAISDRAGRPCCPLPRLGQSPWLSAWGWTFRLYSDPADDAARWRRRPQLWQLARDANCAGYLAGAIFCMVLPRIWPAALLVKFGLGATGPQLSAWLATFRRSAAAGRPASRAPPYSFTHPNGASTASGASTRRRWGPYLYGTGCRDRDIRFRRNRCGRAGTLRSLCLVGIRPPGGVTERRRLARAGGPLSPTRGNETSPSFHPVNTRVSGGTAEIRTFTLASGLAGFGYIITATFLPVITRERLRGSLWLDLFWPIFRSCRSRGLPAVGAGPRDRSTRLAPRAARSCRLSELSWACSCRPSRALSQEACSWACRSRRLLSSRCRTCAACGLNERPASWGC